MNRETITKTYSKAATETQPDLCCAVDYRTEFGPEELDHIPDAVIDRNYGCGVPQELKRLREGLSVLDLGPGLGRDCFIAARKVGSSGRVLGLDMNEKMLEQAKKYKEAVVSALGYDNLSLVQGQFDDQIPADDDTIDVIFSNCVNNLALDKVKAYQEMYRVLKPGSKLSFSDIVSYQSLPETLKKSERAWADCVAGVLSFGELSKLLTQTGFQAITLKTDYLWKKGGQILENYFSDVSTRRAEELAQIAEVRLYSVSIEAYKPLLDPLGPCYWRGQFAIYNGPGSAFHLDSDPEHVFPVGEVREVCEKTATILKSEPFSVHFTVFEPEGEVEARACDTKSDCC